MGRDAGEFLLHPITGGTYKESAEATAHLGARLASRGLDFETVRLALDPAAGPEGFGCRGGEA